MKCSYCEREAIAGSRVENIQLCENHYRKKLYGGEKKYQKFMEMAK